LKVSSDLINILDSSSDNQSVLLVLDMTAAFDTVEHSILLRRLDRPYGVSGNALNWFISYLSDRHQSGRIRDKQSSSCHVPCGVPQGSVLGPLLFILYIADGATIPEKTWTIFSPLCRRRSVVSALSSWSLTPLYVPAESLLVLMTSPNQSIDDDDDDDDDESKRSVNQNAFI